MQATWDILPDEFASRDGDQLWQLGQGLGRCIPEKQYVRYHPQTTRAVKKVTMRTRPLISWNLEPVI
jgi:hypothetical protein